MRPDADSLPKPVPSTILKRLQFEIWCLALVFLPFPGNNNSRKYLTILLTLTTLTIVIGDAFGYAEPPFYFKYVLMLTMLIIGRMWGIQFDKVTTISINYDDENND